MGLCQYFHNGKQFKKIIRKKSFLKIINYSGKKYKLLRFFRKLNQKKKNQKICVLHLMTL